jgi:hypothetical protein
LKRGAIDRAAAHQAGRGNFAGIGPIEIGQQRGGRIRRNGGDRSGSRTEAKTMQRESRSMGIGGHNVSS